MKEKIKISIIEDSEIHREWLNIELSGNENLQVVSADVTGKKGIESVRAHKPAMVLLDFQLEDMTGLEVSKRIKAYLPEVKMFALTAHTEISIIERIIDDKNIDALAIKGSHYFEENFLSSINYVLAGGSYLDPSLLKKLRESNSLNGLSKLTKREFEVFIQKNSGKADEKISNDLCVELSHIRNLNSRIAKKIKSNDLSKLLFKLQENLHPDVAITKK